MWLDSNDTQFLPKKLLLQIQYELPRWIDNNIVSCALIENWTLLFRPLNDHTLSNENVKVRSISSLPQRLQTYSFNNLKINFVDLSVERKKSTKTSPNNDFNILTLPAKLVFVFLPLLVKLKLEQSCNVFEAFCDTGASKRRTLCVFVVCIN